MQLTQRKAVAERKQIIQNSDKIRFELLSKQMDNSKLRADSGRKDTELARLVAAVRASEEAYAELADTANE